MQLGNVTVEPTVSRIELLIMLLWGKPACGKTIAASTAPGRKLWLQFDPSGTASLERSDDILVADFASYKPAQLANFKQGGMIERDLLKNIPEHNINTVVVDSLTSFGQMALSYALVSGKANVGKFQASIEQPGQTGYGIRGSMLLDFCTMILRVCQDTKAHCIFIAHDREVFDDNGSLKEITVSLGGQSQTVIPAKISEIWHMEDTGRDRRIYVRSHGVKTLMRTRMFEVDAKRNNFIFPYDQSTRTTHASGDGIATWYEQWKANGFNRIPLPT